MMKSKPKWLNVTYDLLRTQVEWMLWYVGVVFLIYLLGDRFYSEDFTMSDMGLSSVKGFLLVIGIITAVYGTKTFLKVGVTRKAYFLGHVLSTYLLSLIIFIVFTILNLAMFIILKNYPLANVRFEYFIQWMVLAPQFYFLGWTATLAFQRFKVVGGIITAVLLFGVLTGLESLWNEALFKKIDFVFWSLEISTIHLSFLPTLALSLVITLLTLFSIYKLSQNLEINV